MLNNTYTTVSGDTWDIVAYKAYGKANTAAVLQAYGVRGNATASQREAAEHIAVRSQEAYRELRRMGGNR